MKEASRLPAVPGSSPPEIVAVEIEARSQPAGLFSSAVDVDVRNNSPSPLICDIRGRTTSGETQMKPGYVWIDPNTTGTLHVRVGVRLPAVHTVIVRMRDSSREYLAEAAVAPPIALRVLPLLALAALAALAIVLFVLLGRPQIQALSAPAHAMAGDRVGVGYAASGVGTIRYSVTRDGRTVESGTLADRTGTLQVQTDRRAGTYDVSVGISGIAGSASAQQRIQTQAPPSTPIVAAIHSLDAQPPVAMSGTSIDVRYSASAQSGTIRLVDSKGTPWDAAPYNARGSTILQAPHVDAPQHFTIRMDVRNDASTAAASTGIVIVPSPSPSPSPSLAPFGTPPPASVAAVTTTPAYIVSGTYFVVTLRGAAANVSGRATLQSAKGTPLQAQDVAPGQQARFIAPGVKRATTFYVMVSATHERAGQLIVVPVVVHPS